jgi:hypothetical protein
MSKKDICPKSGLPLKTLRAMRIIYKQRQKEVYKYLV